MELNTRGFHVLRSTTGKRADAVVVTPALIPAREQGGNGAEYVWRDTTVQPGVTYTYWLMEVENDGAITIHGPATSTTQPAIGPYRVILPLIIR